MDRRIFFNSRELRWVQFDSKISLLTTEFKTGGVYQYQRVPKEKFDGLLAAESRGRYFNANIRGHYPYVQIS